MRTQATFALDVRLRGGEKLLVVMELTENSIENFINALRNRLIRELKAGAPIKIQTRDHYPEPRITEVEGRVFPYPAIGETISIQIGYKADELPV